MSILAELNKIEARIDKLYARDEEAWDYYPEYSELGRYYLPVVLEAARKLLVIARKASASLDGLEAENARLKAELAVVEAKQCAWCKWWEPVLFHKDTGEADYGNCAAWEDVESSMLTERTGFCHRWQPEEAADAESV